MIPIADVVNSINNAFPIFSHGEGYIEEFFNKCPVSDDEVRQQREELDRLSKNVFEFVRRRFPALGERDRSRACGLRLNPIRKKIRQVAKGYECYRSIAVRREAQDAGGLI